MNPKQDGDYVAKNAAVSKMQCGIQRLWAAYRVAYDSRYTHDGFRRILSTYGHRLPRGAAIRLHCELIQRNNLGAQT